MVNYSMGFYCYRESFTEQTMIKTLEAVNDLAMSFFPASIWVSRKAKLVLTHPSEYKRSNLPSGYFISGGIARIPFECANGVGISFKESNNLKNIPANMVLSFSGSTINENGWKLSHFISVFKAVIENFDPDYAVLYDEEHRGRPTYDQRLFEFDMRRVPLGLFWINYFGTEWVKNMGLKRLERLQPMVPHFESVKNGGVLLAIQEAPYDESIEQHRIHQEQLEELLGLRELQASFPNPGV